MRAVLDTVIFVRALLNPQGRWGRLLFDSPGRYVIVLSPMIVREIIEVLHRPEIENKIPRLEFTIRFTAILSKLEEAEIVEPTDQPPVCRGPGDDKFFWCAVSGGADYIVSEDRDMLDVSEYQGAKTASAEQFMRILDN